MVAPTGKDAGLGKRSLLDRYSVLILNRDIVSTHLNGWTESDINGRAKTLGRGRHRHMAASRRSWSFGRRHSSHVGRLPTWEQYRDEAILALTHEFRWSTDLEANEFLKRARTCGRAPRGKPTEVEWIEAQERQGLPMSLEN